MTVRRFLLVVALTSALVALLDSSGENAEPFELATSSLEQLLLLLTPLLGWLLWSAKARARSSSEIGSELVALRFGGSARPYFVKTLVQRTASLVLLTTASGLFLLVRSYDEGSALGDALRAAPVLALHAVAVALLFEGASHRFPKRGLLLATFLVVFGAFLPWLWVLSPLGVTLELLRDSTERTLASATLFALLVAQASVAGLVVRRNAPN